MPRRAPLLVVAMLVTSGVACVLAVGAAGEGAAAAARAPQPDALADCRRHVESGQAPLGGPRPQDLRLGRLAFSGLRTAAAFAGAPDYGYDGRLWFSLKSAPTLSAGRAVTVAVAPAFRDVVRIGVGGIPGYHLAVRYRPCAPGHPAFSYDGTIGRWTGWSGGFLASRRVCAELQVWDGDRVAYRHLPLGKPCR
jgi:hypothetical protein